MLLPLLLHSLRWQRFSQDRRSIGGHCKDDASLLMRTQRTTRRRRGCVPVLLASTGIYKIVDFSNNGGGLTGSTAAVNTRAASHCTNGNILFVISDQWRKEVYNERKGNTYYYDLNGCNINKNLVNFVYVERSNPETLILESIGWHAPHESTLKQCCASSWRT